MHKKHRISISGLLLAASFILPISLTGLQAREIVQKRSADRSDEQTSEAATAKADHFFIAEGKASYYANRFHGRKTASGEHFDRRDYTAAHRSLPFGTKLRVTNLDNGRHVVVKVNDRGPHIRNRIIDISQAAAKEIGISQCGIGNVRIEAYN
jgi:rare lipoprotein A